MAIVGFHLVQHSAYFHLANKRFGFMCSSLAEALYTAFFQIREYVCDKVLYLRYCFEVDELALY